MIVVTYESNEFVCHCDFANREVAKTAGFFWNPTRKQWVSKSPAAANKLKKYADAAATKEIARIMLTHREYPWPLLYPEDLDIFPFQERAARFALERNRCYLALDPGLGKTIVAALITNALKAPVIYLCPPFLVANTAAEFAKWSIDKHIMISSIRNANSATDVTIVPDSLIGKAYIQAQLKQIVTPNHVLIIDEAHRFKSSSAERTKATFKFARDFDRVICMSGTPMPNRPIELFPVLKNLAPETISFRNEFEYAMRYCAGHKTLFGWDFNGASNIDELQKAILPKFMLRMRKREVLSELPEKLEEAVVVSEDMPPALAKLDREILREISPTDLMRHAVPSTHVATYRRELGLLKVPYVEEFVRSILDETDESVLVFAIHKEVIARLHEALDQFRPLVITGATPMADRNSHVLEFQNDPTRRLFLGNIQAAGTGFTLTKATRVVFAEFSWVPADNEQATDRAHRIGQKDAVLAQYLVFRNSIDRFVLDAIFKKNKTIQKF